MSDPVTTASAAPVRLSRWRRGFAWAVGLLVALLLSGVVSFYASGSPDGLEWVAVQADFAQAADDHAAGFAPLADYQLASVTDPRLSGGLAGVIGTLLVLAIGLGVMWALRRRPSRSA